LIHLRNLLEKNPNISKFRFFKFTFKNRVQDRITDLTQSEKRLLDGCIKHKEKYSCSFWESYIRSGSDTSSRLFEHATFHNQNNEYINIESKEVFEFINAKDIENIAINSQVILNDGRKLHIPMLDFELPYSEGNIEIIRNVICNLKLKGAIFNSGKSYHFVGYELISEGELIDLLAKFSLLYPISDSAWCSHQIIERSASLRVSKKYGSLPIFLENYDYMNQ